MSARVLATYPGYVAALISRRASLLAFGSAALASSAAWPNIGLAKKKKKANCKKKENQRCKNDTGACLDTLAIGCASSPDPECVQRLTPCCETCSADGFLTCLLTSQSEM